MRDEGSHIDAVADTRSKQRGADIRAFRGQEELILEVKGYPSTLYRDPKRSAEQKRTNPTNQAQHWYSRALLKAVRLQNAYPNALVGVAFPHFPRYQRLFEDTQRTFQKLGIAVYFVKEACVARVC
ncbi:MAG: hypothetical protein ACR2K5_16405 [Pseudolabrys sp.]